MDISYFISSSSAGILLAFSVVVIFLIFWTYRTAKIISLFGKHVLITGGSSGIGKWVAIEAVKAGANVTILARDAHKLQAAVEEIKKFIVHPSQRINFTSLDVSNDYPFIERNLLELEAKFGPVYMLFCCAGTAICGTIEQLSIEDVHHLINLNFLGSFHVIKALVPALKARREGYIIITGSQASLLGIYGYSTYCSTKFALRGLAECLQMELKPYNVNITFALPPDTDTPGFANEEKSKPEATREISQKGGLFKPETVATQIMRDTLARKFFSTVGFDGSLLTILCCGMSPASSFGRLLIESSLMGIFRLICCYIRYDMTKIVEKHEKKTIQRAGANR